MAKKNRRVKSAEPALISIKNWVHADETIRAISVHQALIRKLEDTAKCRIDKVKADIAAKIKPSQDVIKIHQRSLEAFATSRQADFGKDRSKKLNFGTLGWRKSTAINITKKTLELLKQVFGSKAKAFIRTKEEPDKEAMARLTDEDLVRVGARRKSKDVFFVEPDLPEAVDYGK